MSNRPLKMGIIGHGFVGKATDTGFTRNVEKFIVDPVLGTKTKDLAIMRPDVIFVSVPTPMGRDGKINDQIIVDVAMEILDARLSCPVVVKSTITPEVVAKLDTLLPKFVYNPEFLREASADYDFINSDMVVLGGKPALTQVIEQMYRDHSNVRECPYYHTDPYTASMVKYTINCFLSLKIGFFNQVYDVYNKLPEKGAWEDFTQIVGTDHRIGASHMQVPGPDGRRGWGGACFQKDTNAMVNYTPFMTILEKAIAENNQIRSNYALDEREKEQNVTFDKA